MTEAQKIANARGMEMGTEGSLRGMHWVKTALDDLQKKTAAQSKDNLAFAYSDLSRDMTKGLGEMSPAYDAARLMHQTLSKPINEMDVGQALSDKLIPALRDFGGNGNLNASAYAQALRNGDAVAQRALGMPKATINDVLPPEKIQTLHNIAQDLARASNAKKLAAADGSDSLQNLTSQGIIRGAIDPLGLPAWASKGLAESKFMQTVLRPAEYVADYGNKALMEDLAKMLVSPQKTSDSLRQIMSEAAKNGAPGIQYIQPKGNTMLPSLGSYPRLI